jgi:hypothetical protein
MLLPINRNQGASIRNSQTQKDFPLPLYAFCRLNAGHCERNPDASGFAMTIARTTKIVLRIRKAIWSDPYKICKKMTLAYLDVRFV